MIKENGFTRKPGQNVFCNHFIISFTFDDGKQEEFKEIATVILNDNLYCILNPASAEEDEVVVTHVTRKPNGDAKYSFKVDDETFDAVLNEYYNFMETYEEDEV